MKFNEIFTFPLTLSHLPITSPYDPIKIPIKTSIKTPQKIKNKNKFTQPTIIIPTSPSGHPHQHLYPTNLTLTPTPIRPSDTSPILISFPRPSSILIIFSNFNKINYFQHFRLHLHRLSYSSLFQIFLFQSKCPLFL